MKCPNCGNKLPFNAKYCDICGHKIRPESPPDKDFTQKAGDWMLEIAMAIVVVMIMSIIAGLLGLFPKSIDVTSNSTDAPSTEEAPMLSIDQYNALKEGMDWNSYLNAASKGLPSGTARTGKHITAAEYGWSGPYSNGEIVVHVIFEAPKHEEFRISEIREYNFLDGQEINSNEGKTAHTALSFEELNSMPNGTTYEEFSEKAGTKGLLTSSWSVKDGDSYKRYTWNYGENDFPYHAVFKNGQLDNDLENH